MTLEDYVNQTKLMELLRYELPDAEELGITEKQYHYLIREQFKLTLEKLDQKVEVATKSLLQPDVKDKC